MKHVRCYACNKLGHIAKECRNKVWAPYQKEKMSSSRLKIWRKKEVQSEKDGTVQCTDIPESEEAESTGCSTVTGDLRADAGQTKSRCVQDAVQ